MPTPIGCSQRLDGSQFAFGNTKNLIKRQFA
jgi:hypothetical protein